MRTVSGPHRPRRGGRRRASPGCRPRCTCWARARGHRGRAGADPGGRAGRLDLGGYRLDTGPTVLTMPDLVEDAFAAVGENARATAWTWCRLRPGLPRAVRRRQRARRAHRRRRHGRRGRRGSPGPPRRDGYRRLRAWLDRRCTRREIGRFIDANFDSPLAPGRPDLARLAALGGVRPAGAARSAASSATSGCAGSSPSRRCTRGSPPARALASYAVIAYMDTVAGVYFPRGGMQALPEALAGAAAARRASPSLRHHRSPRWSGPGRGSPPCSPTPGAAPRATRWCSPPTCPPRTGCSAARRAGRCRCGPSPSAVVLHAGTGRRWPDAAPPHDRRSAAPGGRRSARSSPRGG